MTKKLAVLLTTGKKLLKAFLCLNTIKWPIKCDKKGIQMHANDTISSRAQLNYHS